MQPVIAITTGDPAGVGPEVTLKALADPAIASLARWKVIGDRFEIERQAALFGLDLPPEALIVDLGLLQGEEAEFGKASARCGRAAVGYVKHAAQMCLDGAADAMVTAPLNKEAVSMGGLPFSGHTEYIAGVCGAKDSRMLLASERMRVVHVTTHVPLRRACESTVERIVRTIELGCEAVRLLGFEQPRIAVCGLNPHAGENGLFGTEDQERIVPAIAAARAKGIPCEGPLPADTVFLRALGGEFDLVVAMYHDQGHIPMKLVDFENTVNVSLGLPIIRTSVDHGTAFDIAGKNLAGAANMKTALRLALTMAANRARDEAVRQA